MKGEVSLIWLGAAHDLRNTWGPLVKTGLLSLIPIASRRIIPAANCFCSYIGNKGKARRNLFLGASKSTTAPGVDRILKLFRERRTNPQHLKQGHLRSNKGECFSTWGLCPQTPGI